MMAPNERRVVFLKGRLVDLRPMRKSTDLEACLRWINDPDVARFLKHSFPSTEIGEAKWFDRLEERNEDVVLAIETKTGEFIGVMGLHRIDLRNGIATTGALIGEKKYWGKGYGTDAKMLVLEYAFNELGLRKVCSEVFEFNGRSIAYSMHCGYKIEGRLKRHVLKRGHYWDKVILAVFKEDWIPVWRKYRKTGSVR